VSHKSTFVRVADDCPAPAAEVPPARKHRSVAELQYSLLVERPYELTEEELHVKVHGLRRALIESEIEERYDELYAEVFAKPQACLRASPLTKRYGFGAHYDADGRIALYPRESDTYARLAGDSSLRQLTAMRSTRHSR
jgi:hypothetical protein